MGQARASFSPDGTVESRIAMGEIYVMDDQRGTAKIFSFPKYKQNPYPDSIQ